MSLIAQLLEKSHNWRADCAFYAALLPFFPFHIFLIFTRLILYLVFANSVFYHLILNTF